MITARHNPFRAERVDALSYALSEGSWDALSERLERMHYRGAVTGRHGSGKTTLLESLKPQLESRGFIVRSVFLNDATPRICRRQVDAWFCDADARCIVFCDGADCMSRRLWERCRLRSRDAGGLIVTSHREGLLPTLVHCRTTPPLLRRLAEELLEGDVSAMGAELDGLFKTHDGNLREVFRELYDRSLNLRRAVEPRLTRSDCSSVVTVN